MRAEPVLAFAGVVTEPGSASGHYKFVDFENDVRLGERKDNPRINPIRKWLPLKSRRGKANRVKVEQAVAKLTIAQGKPYRLYTALLGPELDPGEDRPRLNTDNVAEGWIETSAPTVYVEEGWAYLSGESDDGEEARIRSKWVVVVPCGCSTILRIIGDGYGDTIHRVYFLKGESIKVTCGGDTKRSSTARQYIDVREKCTFSEWRHIPDDDPFVTEVKKIAAAD